MRVAYLINQYPKVSHSFIRREIQALERQGIEILRFALRGWNDEIVDRDDLLERDRTRYVLKDGIRPLATALVRAFVTAPRRFLKALTLTIRMSRKAERPLLVHLIYLAEACRVLSWMQRLGAKHVHAHFGTNSAEVAMLASLLGDLTWSFTVHGPEEFDKAPVIGLSEKLRSCAFVVAISSYGRSQLYRLVEQDRWHKVHVVHCGVDDSFMKAEAPYVESRKFVCVGRICEQKGQFLLVEAAAQLAKEGVEFQLTLAGDGELRHRLEELVARRGLQDRISITGWIDAERVRAEIISSRALVLPSFAEGLPVVLMEAMALLRPVVSTYVAGIPELVIDGKNGWLVPAGDIDGLCIALRACLDAAPAILEEMGKHGRACVASAHDITKEAERLATLFSIVANNKSKDPDMHGVQSE